MGKRHKPKGNAGEKALRYRNGNTEYNLMIQRDKTTIDKLKIWSF